MSVLYVVATFYFSDKNNDVSLPWLYVLVISALGNPGKKPLT